MACEFPYRCGDFANFAIHLLLTYLQVRILSRDLERVCTLPEQFTHCGGGDSVAAALDEFKTGGVSASDLAQPGVSESLLLNADSSP